MKLDIIKHIHAAHEAKRVKNAERSPLGAPQWFIDSLNDGIVIDPVECVDGFKLSIQASSSHYCIPRSSKPGLVWAELECGFPTAPVPSLADFKGDDGPDMENVFSYVPVELVVGVLREHGGLK